MGDMNITAPKDGRGRGAELSFVIFSNCQGFVLIPQDVLRLLVFCVI